MARKKSHVRVGTFKPIYKGVLFTVEQAIATLPTGEKKRFERVKRKHSAIILPIDAKGKIWMARQYMSVARQFRWTLPAGQMEARETPKNAAQRELREETGFRAQQLIPFFEIHHHQQRVWSAFCFVAKGLIRDPLPEDDGEELTIVPMTIERAVKLALSSAIENELVAYLILRLYLQRKKWKI